MGNRTSFETTKYANRIEEYKNEILSIFEKCDQVEVANSLRTKLDEISNADKINVAFVGQYSAGKSTIISALTGDKSIKIDSDIATSETKPYSWGNVNLVDTPGLYTENQEHNNITNNEILKSDLLIYCITSDLFNPYTLADFKRLAFEEKYAGKMFLVVNKMSKEDGQYEELVESYKETINMNLYPHSIEEFGYAFIDAQDYRTGISENDEGLIQFSHFEDLIKGLNEFIRLKGQLGKFDVPISLMKDAIDGVVEELLDDETNKSYKAFLSRIERKVNDLKKHISKEANRIVGDSLQAIIDKGYDISRQIGTGEIKFSEEEVNALIESCCSKANSLLEALYSSSYERLKTELEEVCESPVAQKFFESVDGTFEDKSKLFEGKKAKLNRIQYKGICDTLGNITGKIVEKCANESEAVGYFLKATGANGSKMHEAVLAVGHKLGHKFKPWEAANIAKNIGNAAKVAGSALAVFGAVMDAKGTIDEERNVKLIEQKQIECRTAFKDMSDELTSKYNEQFANIFTVYDDVTNELHTNQEAIDKLMKEDNAMYKRLEVIRAGLTSIQSEIYG